MAIKGTGRLEKGYIENMATRKVRRFQYNPEMFTDDVSVEYRAIKSPGISYPIYQYVGGDVRVIDFTLFLDEVEGGNNLRDTIKFIEAFVPTPNKGKQFVPPPEMIFGFGSFVKTCILVNRNIAYTLFDKNLKPIRAEVTLSLQVVQ